MAEIIGTSLGIIFVLCVFVGIPILVILGIKCLIKFLKNSNAKHKKEMELMQAQLDFYKNSSENDT